MVTFIVLPALVKMKLVPKYGYVHSVGRFSQNETVSLYVTIKSTSPIRTKNLTSRDRKSLVYCDVSYANKMAHTRVLSSAVQWRKIICSLHV